MWRRTLEDKRTEASPSMVGLENIITRAQDWTISKQASNLFQSSGIRGSQCKIPLLPNCEKDQLCLLSRAPSWTHGIAPFHPHHQLHHQLLFHLILLPPHLFLLFILFLPPHPQSLPPPLHPFSHPSSPWHVNLVPQLHCFWKRVRVIVPFLRDYCIFQHFVTNSFIWSLFICFVIILRIALSFYSSSKWAGLVSY